LNGIVTTGITWVKPSPDRERISEIWQNSESESSPNKNENEIKQEQETESLYQSYLRRANETPLDDIENMNILYSPTISSGKRVVVTIGQNLPTSQDQLEKTILYLIKSMDKIVNSQYYLLYFHSDMSSRTLPDFSWIRTVHKIFDKKYGKNLVKLYIIHPTFWMKLFFTFMSPFLSKRMDERMQYIGSLKELFQIFPRKSLNLPKEILRYDELENDAIWNEPERDSTIL